MPCTDDKVLEKTPLDFAHLCNI